MADFEKAIRDHFASLVRCMNQRDVKGLAARNVVPFAAYLLDEIVVSETRQELEERTRVRMELVMAAPVVKAWGRIVDLKLECDGRATVMFQWEFLTETGAVRFSDLIRYMVSRPDDKRGLIVEMVEYVWISDHRLAEDALEILRNRKPAWKGMH